MKLNLTLYTKTVKEGFKNKIVIEIIVNIQI